MKEIELKNLRREREKHFLQEDGTIIAKVYNDDIHFKRNGQYEEIDNTITKENEYYTNKNNDYKVYFKSNSDTELMEIQEGEHYLNINLLDSNNVPVKKEDSSKLTSSIKYENILSGIDLEYKVLPTKVKENIIINNKKSVVDKLNFIVDTDLELIKNDNGSISALYENKNIFNIEAPYMIDFNNNTNTNLYYKIIEDNNKYKLELLLDTEWLNEASYPVVIDPTITNQGQNCSVYDTYIYPGDDSIDRNNQDILKSGVEKINGKDIVNRTLIKFDLPTIGTGSQVISAFLSLIGYALDEESNESDIINVHRITNDWTEETAKWSSMNDKFDSRIEGSFNSIRSYTMPTGYHEKTIIPKSCGGDITSLVKKWYSDTPNYGILLKENKEVYRNDIIPAFYSKNNKIVGDSPQPVLIVSYRNQNGLEDYMDYVNQTFIEGNTYINSYNGNLTASFNLGSTISGKLPASLSLFYNTNDVILNNNNGLGIGYKLNLYQTIREVVIEDIKYLEYLDEDGTIHYFRREPGEYHYDEDGKPSYVEGDENTYLDEDGLNMTIYITSSDYILVDKLGNKCTFSKKDNIGYLNIFEDMKGDKIKIIYDNNNLITKVIDANGMEINIIYENNKVIINSPDKVSYINYTNNKIVNIETISGTTLFNYNEKNLISDITDVTGKKFFYEYYNEIPYRVKKVSEYGLNNSLGQYFTMEYNFNSTTLINNKNNSITKTFNNNGNLISISNLSSKDNIRNAYGKQQLYNQTVEIENEVNKVKNKLLEMDIPNKYIKNYLNNTSFENDKITFNYNEGLDISITEETAEFGLKCLKVVNSKINNEIIQSVSVPKGNNYTFSCYIKNTNIVKLSLCYIDINNNFIENISEPIKVNDKFNRYEVSINYPSNSIGDLIIKIYFYNIGTTYIDGIQLEEGEIANNYNMIENSDFSNGLGDWILSVEDNETLEPLSTENKFKVVNINDLGDKALKISMDVTERSSVSKKYYVNGKGGDTYNISFWYKNEAFPTSGLEGDEINNEVMIFFNYLNQEYGHGLHGFTFNPNYSDWQFFSQNFTAENDFDFFRLDFYQAKNANSLYITNLCLYRDVNSIQYDYDEEGNITSFRNLDKSSSKFNYNKDNQLIQMLNPKGKRFHFEYDNILSDKLINAISDFGISNKIKFDAYGNPIYTKVLKNNVSNLKNGLYKIRLKGTNSYIRYINNKPQILNDNCNHDLFYLEKEDEYYKIKHSLIQNKYLTIDNLDVKFSSYDSDNSLFTLLKQENGSYHIESKVNNKCLKYDGNELIVYQKGTSENSEMDYHFEFYFETSDNNLFIENSAEYNEDGRFIKSTTDTLFNKTKYDVNEVNGLINSVTNAKNQVTNYVYDDKQRLISVFSGSKSINYNYNSKNILSSINQGNKTFKFINDNFLNTKQIKLNDIILVNYDYEDNNGNLKTSTYGNNQSINYLYDEFSRVKQIIKMDDIYRYIYDNNGNPVRLISNDSIVKCIYDSAKKIKEYNYNKFKIKYLYDTQDNIVNTNYSLESLDSNIENIFDEDDMLIKTKFDNNEVNYEYDSLGRINNNNINNQFSLNYEYVTNGNRTSYLIKNNRVGNDLYSYKYDKLNNITHIYHNNILQNKYYYDGYNQLIEEINYLNNEHIKYEYDNSGNLLSKKIYDLNNCNLIKQEKYEYSNLNWEDQLTKFNNDFITYDEIGNPLTIGNDIVLNWINGRELKAYNDLNKTIEYKYNKDGIRISKKINNLETNYYLENNNIILEKTGNSVLYYIYNGIGELVGFKFNNDLYYYIKNIQDDIIGILDSNYNIVAKYSYDSWGNILSITDGDGIDVSSNINHIGNINPFRYRGYYYDKEIDFYYLNNRYYNPKWGRFLNADPIIGSKNTLLTYNMYLYADNNPIMNIDTTGLNWFKKTWDGLYNFGKQVSQTARKAYNDVKKAFVFEIGVGVGLDLKGKAIVGASLGYSKDMTFKFENGKSSTGSSTSLGAEIGTTNYGMGATTSYYHEYHNVPGDIDKTIDHTFILPSVFQVNDCDYGQSNTSIFFGRKNNTQKYETDKYTTFIGVDLSWHVGVGGHLKLGFNVDW